jgi:PKD repeat protein
MTDVPRPRAKATLLRTSSLLAIVVLALLGLASAASAAEPSGYGELTRFGEEQGSSFEGHLAPGLLRARAIGVDPTDNSVYVLDEPKEPSGKNRFVRLRKFVANGSGEYSVKASVEFKVTVHPFKTASNEATVEPTIEGLSVDPSTKRVYLLVVDVREKQLKHASRTPGEDGVQVASALYAFSTVESGGALVAASGTKPGGILIGAEELAAQSETPGAALLQPTGIALDPATGEVIVLAHENKTTEQADNTRSASDHYVLQRITSAGALGSRYVDQTNFLKEEQSPERFPTPNSPTVVSAGGKEHVDISFDQGIAEIPYEFTSSAAPKFFPGALPGIEGGISASLTGGVISSAEGTVFGTNFSGIVNQEPGGEGRGGVVAYSGENAAEIGWTGGAQERESEPKGKCVISQRNFSLSPLVAAGSGGKIFVLAPEFLLREQEGEPIITEVENPPGSEEFEIIETPTFEPLAGPFFAPVIELGPGGTGCPQASATTPLAKVNNIEVKAEESVKPDSEVVFSSQVKQADALKVEWSFGDGAKETVSTNEFQSTTAKHKYTTEGTYTVTERIYSDDLAAPEQAVYKEGHLTTPTITVTRTLLVGTHPPKAQFTGLSSAKVGEAVTFTSHSTDPNGPEGLPLESAWSFGDGASAASGSTQTHSYAAAGTYTVTLTVTDHLGLKNSFSQPITVTSGGGGGGGGGGGNGGSGGGNGGGGNGGGGSGGGGGGGSAPPGAGQGGVLSYSVSLAGTALSVSKVGAFVLKVNCGGQSSCTGSAVLRTVSAVSAGAGKHKAILTLASGSFAIAGGQVKALTLHLTSQARALLGRLHVLRAKVSIVAHDATGASHTTTLIVTLRATKHH